jgi:phage terminase large subunit
MRFSIKALIELQIEKMGQTHNWDITRTSIINRRNNSEFVFYGMNVNPQSSKSFEGCDVLLAEEANDLSNKSLTSVIPTVIRNPGSICVWIFNPEYIDDPVYDEFITHCDPKTTNLTYLTFLNNPYTTQATIDQARKDRRKNNADYEWQWLGKLKDNSEVKVLGSSFTVQDFDEHDLGDPYFGLDFGFSPDPMVLIKAYFDEETCYIRYSHCRLKHEITNETKQVEFIPVELDELPEFLKEIPGTDNYPIKADSSRPDIISYLNRNNYTNVTGATKPPGSIEFGIKWLRTKHIIIHPEAKLAIFEANNYKHKVHKKTKEILRDIEDKNNHTWDAVRYGFVKLIYDDRYEYSSRSSPRKYN